MATVINTFPDKRGEALGKGLGSYIAQVMEARRKEEEKDRLKETLRLFSESLQGGTQTVTKDIPREQRVRTSLELGGGPTNRAADVFGSLPSQIQTEKEITGADVAISGLDAGLDHEFLLTLAKGIEENRLSRKKTARDKEGLNNVLTAAMQSGAKRADVLASMANSNLTPDKTISLIGLLNELVPDEDEDLEPIKLFHASDPSKSITVQVPRLISQDLTLLEDYVAKHFKGFSAVPRAPLKGEALPTLKGQAVAAMLERREIDQHTADAINAGALIARGPDATGKIALIDQTRPGNVKFVGGGKLTTESLSRLDRRITATTNAIYMLGRADTSQVGLNKILAARIGGIAIQIPVIGTIANALGLNKEVVAEAQASQGEFTSIIIPLLQSFAPGGSQRNSATKQQIALADRMLNMTNFASTPAGAELSKRNLIEILKDVRASMVAQRITESFMPPDRVKFNYSIGEDGNIKVTYPGGSK